MAKLDAKADAVLPLAMGRSKAETARRVGVSVGTVTRWLTEPEFKAEVEALRPVATARPTDGAALLAAIEECRHRIVGVAMAQGRATVHVSIPANATPAQRRRILARAMARGITALSRDVL
jgi:hypothetical protein